jgi:thiamine biosynthesis lipoprotein
LADHGKDEVFEACFARLRELDRALNMWDPDSELARLNARAGRGPVKVSADLLTVALRGLELARQSEGILDPTVGPTVRLWGIGTPGARVPSQAEVDRARLLVDWRKVRVDPGASTIELAPGMALDFGSLAKGYGALEGSRLLASLGVRSGLLDVGGCIVCIGSGSRGRAWRIGVQDPRAIRGRPLGFFTLRDSAVDTSGIYERYFEASGKRYPHIMDTRTGRPVEGRLVSVSVVLPRQTNSDGPPLAILVLGPQEGLALADRLGLPAVLVTDDKRILLSKAAKPLFTLLDRSFVLLSEPGD